MTDQNVKLTKNRWGFKDGDDIFPKNHFLILNSNLSSCILLFKFLITKRKTLHYYFS